MKSMIALLVLLVPSLAWAGVLAAPNAPAVFCGVTAHAQGNKIKITDRGRHLLLRPYSDFPP